ncbi:hypothetical protein RCZ04_07880 [Capnocytophaga sp. HP1101]
MKKVLFSFVAMAALIGCGSKDDDTPNGGNGNGGNGTTTPTTQNEYLPTKKVRTISCNFIEVEIDYKGGSPAPSLESVLEPTLNGQKFVAKTLTFAYDYDEKGRINKITRKEEGEEDNVKTFTYGATSVKISLPNEDTGEVENFEVGLNAAGNMLGIGAYDSKQRLTNVSRIGDFEWTNGNLTKITEKKNWGDKITIFENQLSYNNNLNKNKFLLYNFEGDIVGSYMQYFDFRIGWIQGVAPKNLLQQMVLTEDGTALNYTYNYTYTFDNDGFVKTINETRNARAGMPTGFGGFDATYLTTLETLIKNIENGTEKNRKYQLISDKADEKVFDIIIPIKIEKDKNGKTMNLTVNKVVRHTIKLKTENGEQVLDRIGIDLSYNSDMTTTYQLNY